MKIVLNRKNPVLFAGLTLIPGVNNLESSDWEKIEASKWGKTCIASGVLAVERKPETEKQIASTLYPENGNSPVSVSIEDKSNGKKTGKRKSN